MINSIETDRFFLRWFLSSLKRGDCSKYPSDEFHGVNQQIAIGRKEQLDYPLGRLKCYVICVRLKLLIRGNEQMLHHRRNAGNYISSFSLIFMKYQTDQRLQRNSTISSFLKTKKPMNRTANQNSFQIYHSLRMCNSLLSCNANPVLNH